MAATGACTLYLDQADPVIQVLFPCRPLMALDWLGSCPRVTQLGIEADCLPAVLPPNLQRLQLHACGFADVPAALAARMGSLRALQHLGLDYGRGAAARLPAHLQWPPALQTIQLTLRAFFPDRTLQPDLAALQSASPWKCCGDGNRAAWQCCALWQR